jgi:hypothetical protein
VLAVVVSNKGYKDLAAATPDGGDVFGFPLAGEGSASPGLTQGITGRIRCRSGR